MKRATPVQRNSGIDGFWGEYVNDKPVSIKIQKEDETLGEAVSKLFKASKTKKCGFMILVRTHADLMDLYDFNGIPDNMKIIDSIEIQLDSLMDMLRNEKKNTERKAI